MAGSTWQMMAKALQGRVLDTPVRPGITSSRIYLER